MRIACRVAVVAAIAASATIIFARGNETHARPLVVRADSESVTIDDEYTGKRTRIGTHLAVPTARPENWERVRSDDGRVAWHMTLVSPGAQFLRPHFAEADARGVLRVLTRAGEAVASEPRTGADAFWGPIVEGDRIVIEWTGPSGMRPRVWIDEISHGTSAFWTLDKEQRCHLDAMCYPEWAEQSSGVGLLTFEEGRGTYLCTGSLIRDLPSTNRPWFLTANHCLSSQDVAETVVVYWHYEAEGCEGRVPPLHNAPQSAGADFVTGNMISDDTLLLLHADPPEDVAFLDWSTDALADGEDITVIHHPGGAYKRITFGNEVASLFTHWLVRYNEGSTEGGSSGSPLFNAEGRIVGQLSGGTAACYRMNGTDEFGKFSMSWTNGLSDYLSTVPTSSSTTTTTQPWDGGSDDDSVPDDTVADDAGGDDDPSDEASATSDDDDGGGCCG